MRRWTPTVALLVGLAVVLPALSLGVAGAAAPPPGGRHHGGHGPPPPTGTLVPYRSSVDNFSLSYLEWLPTGFVPSHHYPLAIYLHGMGNLSAPVAGGVGASSVPTTLIGNATRLGVILISLNTRTEAGFYANTPCGGPQGQDVLDAIAHEKLRRNISEVFAIGFSMGTIGALVLAASHPGLISGVAVAAPLTDLFQEWEYSGSIPNLAADLCHGSPGPKNTTVDRELTFLSPARFAPKNFSDIPLYVTAGGLDRAAPNNPAFWPYLMANSTLLVSSCRSATQLGENASCTTTFTSLEKALPSHFSFRFVYEPDAPHSDLQLDGADLFGFLLGTLGSGVFHADFPAVSVTSGPAPP